MKALRRFFQRLTSWTTSARDEDVLRAEIDDHIARQTADNLRAGMTAIEARRQALLKFGNVDAIKESYRDQRGLPFDGNAPARYAPCPTSPAKDSRVYGRRSPDARLGHRCEHRDLRGRRERTDPAARLPARRGPGRHLAYRAREARLWRDQQLFSIDVLHLSRTESDLSTVRLVGLHRRKRDRRCRARGASSALGHLRSSGCLGREASAGPVVFSRR